jgi:LysM repeat protein
MKKHKLTITFLFALLSNLVFAQSSEIVKRYIATYKDIAMEEMQRTGVPAAITLAQGIHETGAGTSDLVVRSNNHFGIKCKTEWTGEKVYHDDDARGECFRKYEDAFQSYRDHSDFLKNRPYYASLFTLDPTDFEGWAYGLKKAGYATNPKYPQILIKLIKDYNLQDYTLIALGQKKAGEGDAIWASNKTIEKTESSETAKAAVEEIHEEETKVYPSGVFHINETKVIWVAKGTAFLKLAEDNNISLSRLFEFNDMKPVDIAAHGQLIFLQRKRKGGANEFHEVLKNETLYSIAQAEGIRLENLLENNLLKADMQPAVGEKLYLRSKAPSAPRLAEKVKQPVMNTADQKTAGENTALEFITHTVQTKETMFGIARKYSVAVDDVMKWNDLQSMALKTGQKLRINKSSANVN